MRDCASAYVMAARLRMRLLVNRVATMSASGVTSHRTLKASRSSPPRSEQISSVSGLGSMSMRLCTRYTEVARSAASTSIAVPGFRKWVTSAM